MELPLQRRISEKLLFISQQDEPWLFTKHIQDKEPVTHRLRIGDYRALLSFNPETSTIIVYGIGHRSEIY